MEKQRKKIDTTLPDRHRILRLLERLQTDSITIAEMDEIGAKLQNAGRRALPPLVRKLWRERSGNVISRYTYLLDFFDDESWLDQLVQMALRRRDLEAEGKAAFLAALEGYGVDVSAPPFSRLLAGAGGPLHETLPRLLDRGEEGLLCFIDDIIYCEPEIRQAIIRALPSVADRRVVRLLEILLGMEDEEIVRESVRALGMIRDPDAAGLLRDFAMVAAEPFREVVQRSLRRLSFVGVHPVRKHLVPPSPFHHCYVSPFDGAGFRTIWVSRRRDDGGLAVLYLEVHETRGMISAWGREDLDEEGCASQVAELCCEEDLVEVSPEYALLLVREARYRNRENGMYLPPEFYLCRGMFWAEEIVPSTYTPEFAACKEQESAVSARSIADSASLFDDDFFAGWFLTLPRVYDFAEELVVLEKEGRGRKMARGVDTLVERFCRELLIPDADVIRRRILFTADLMRRTGRSREMVERTAAIADGLTVPGLDPWRHPFFRRYALESIKIARETLAEGYDPRQHQEADDEEWE
jgi:hypothetical protein